ncbi:MAG: hypothetical protein J7K04_16105 [Spirochaetales bacterium]|nr:hypothetical protein [Spirochaetales bacterium]
MKRVRAILIIIMLSVLVILPAIADVPVRKEELIYSIMAFLGKEYSGTFCRQEADTFYLMANVDNFITVRKTLVYFWPITQDWKVDTDALNKPFEGTIEIKGKNMPLKKLKQVRYTYYNAPGEYEVNWKVFTGGEADKEWNKYSKLVDKYWKDVGKYYKEQGEYEAKLNALTKRITEARKKGEDTKRFLKDLNKLKKPMKQPKGPSYYVRPIEKAFIFNLPPGEYTIRFLTKDGKIMEGSEKKVVAYKKRRANGVGYDVIPADKWTRPVQSNTPSSILYIDGTTDLYLRPFYQDEFNDLYYNKTVKNDAKGNPNIMKWVRIQQVPKARVEVTKKDATTEAVLEKPYYVQQTKGASLGYKIVPFDPKKAEEGSQPSLRAFHVPIQRNMKYLRVKLQDKNGNYLKGSDRQIRVIIKSQSSLFILILSLLPLAFMFLVIALRSRKYS